MKKWFVVALVLVCSLALISCSQKQATTASDQPVTTPADVKAQQKAPDTQPMTKQAEVAMQDLQAKLMPLDIYFAFDKYDLDDAAKASLKSVASIVSPTSYKIVIEGNCDERGTREYNLALGDKRANAAKQFLVTLGLPSARIDVISYGKEKPQCTDATEACWARNRRDHFVLTGTR
jgi:peptidoglycan-associated lipoprotein